MFLLVSQVLSFRCKKQTSKNVVDTTFKFQVRLIDLSQSSIQILYGLQIENGIPQCVNSS